jgi:sugar lactone lactonase YvrE
MGNLYVADTGNHTIRKVVISTGEVTTVAGIPSIPGFMNSEFGYPMFNYPRGICIIGNHLYVADSGNHLVRRVNLSTGYVGLVAGLSDYVTNTGSSGTSDSTGAAAGFNDPRGITTDGKYLYVTDSGNYTIRRILAATGQVKTIAGMPGEAGYKDSVSFDARFNYPRGITVDGDYLYVADTGNNVFRRVNKDTGEVLTLSGKKGESSFIQGTKEDARYNNVVSVTTSPETPYLYFTDSAENVVGRIEK